MPDMDGIAAVKQIVATGSRRADRDVHLDGPAALVVEAVQAGAKSFITKPFQPPKILETLEKVLA